MVAWRTAVLVIAATACFADRVVEFGPQDDALAAEELGEDSQFGRRAAMMPSGSFSWGSEEKLKESGVGTDAVKSQDTAACAGCAPPIARKSTAEADFETPGGKVAFTSRGTFALKYCARHGIYTPVAGRKRRVKDRTAYPEYVMVKGRDLTPSRENRHHCTRKGECRKAYHKCQIYQASNKGEWTDGRPLLEATPTADGKCGRKPCSCLGKYYTGKEYRSVMFLPETGKARREAFKAKKGTTVFCTGKIFLVKTEGKKLRPSPKELGEEALRRKEKGKKRRRWGRGNKKKPPAKKKPHAKKKPDAKKPPAKKKPRRKPDVKKPPAKSEPRTKKKPDAKKPPAKREEPHAKKKPDAKKPPAKREPRRKPDAKKPPAKREPRRKPDAKKPPAKSEPRAKTKPDAKKPPAKREPPAMGKPAAKPTKIPSRELLADGFCRLEKQTVCLGHSCYTQRECSCLSNCDAKVTLNDWLMSGADPTANRTVEGACRAACTTMI